MDVGFTVSEALVAAPNVALGSAPLGLVSATRNVYLFRRTLDGSERESLQTLTLSATDLAGNLTTETSLTLTTDFTAPTPVNGSVSPSPTHDGQVVTVTFDTPESLAGNPTVLFGGLTAAFDGLSGSTYTFQRTLDGTETEGVTTVAIDTVDPAGNTGNLSLPITLDFTAPALSALSVTPATGRSGTSMTIQFTVSESLAGDPTIIGGQPATRASQTGLAYAYTRTLDGTETEGTATVEIQVQDPAGHVTTDTSLAVSVRVPENGRRTAGERPENGRRTAGERPENGRRTAGERPENGRRTAGGTGAR